MLLGGATLLGPDPCPAAVVSGPLFAQPSPHRVQPDSESLGMVLAMLPNAPVSVDRDRGNLVIEFPSMDLPAHTPERLDPMVMAPLVSVVLPVSGSLSGFRVEVVDAGGRRLPQELLHHLNLSDPGRRELFLPIGLHMFAASKETPAATVPWFLFGVPVVAGQRFIAGAMLSNPTSIDYRGVRVRLILRYTPAARPWPVFRAYPWVMDVLFPVGQQPGGSKAFDLPPGRTIRSWVSSPAIPGTILGMGGHIHDYGVSVEFADSTTGEVIWRGLPVRDSVGQVLSLPPARFYRWNRVGVHITPEHRYRVTVVYENPTGRLIKDGGMGAVAGLFVPDRGTTWPVVDPADPAYHQDLYDTLYPAMGAMKMTGHH
jgi:hypothetical protein